MRQTEGRRARTPGGRLPRVSPAAILAAIIYIPLLLTHRGRIGADTKSYLYLDPDRVLGRAWSMWDPNVGLGTVTHQNIGYLWPMGPFYWAFQHLGIPDWAAQRLWLGSILFFAGLGARSMMKALGQRGPGATATMFVYALSPFVLTLGARISAILLPYCALGWMISLAIRAGRERSWVHPALFALAVPTFGSVNATALILVGVAPVLWYPFAVFVLKELRLSDAVRTIAKIGVLSVLTSLWWIAGLWCQGSFGIDVLRYTETAKTVADSSSAPELLRGFGYWYFYGEDKLGPWIEPSVPYTQNVGLLALTYAIPTLGLLAATLIRWRYRAYFVGLLLLGIVLSVGAHPWDDPEPLGQGFRAFLQSQAGLAMRSLPRAVPLLTLSLATLTGAGVSAVGARWRHLEGRLAAAVAVAAIVALPPLWQGQMVGENLERDSELPAYWQQAAAAIDARDREGDGWRSRVLEVPGIDFASYRWGNTVDPITPGITDRPYAARELIPYGTPNAADVLNALDRQLQEDVLSPEAIAPLARLLGVGDIVLRGDIAYERFNVARPRLTWDLLQRSPGLGRATGFGGTRPNIPDPRLPLEDEKELAADPDLPDPPKVALIPVSGNPRTVSAKPTGGAVILAGSGDGLVEAAAAGVIDGRELIRYSGALAGDGGGADIRQAVGEDGALVITDTNRLRAQRWGSVRETEGYTERVGEKPLEPDPSDNRLPLFPGTGTASQTVVQPAGGVTARSGDYGNPVTYTPENRAGAALDDDLTTVWSVGAFSPLQGESIELAYDSPRSTDRIRLLQDNQGPQNRWIERVALRFDDGPPVEVALAQSSRTGTGQWIDIGRRRFRKLSIEILQDDVGRLSGYDGLAGVGFADIRLGDDDVRLTEAVRPPTDLLAALGPGSLDHPLAFVLTRERTDPAAALRTDEETRLVRLIDLPAARRFRVRGEARLAREATEATVDELLGIRPAREGGVDARSSRHIAGDRRARASAAIDGDPTTKWSPGFLGQADEWLSYRSARPVSFDKMDLQVVADGRHSVPTRLRIEADGKIVDRVDVPAVRDRAERNATVTLPLTLPRPVTGRDIRIVIEKVREVRTIDWISTSEVVMPVGIAELGIPGLSAPQPPARLRTGCRSDLLAVDGAPVPVRVSGSTEEALDGAALTLVGCAGPLELPAGESTLTSERGLESGLQVDRLTLSSAAGGDAATADGPIAPAPDAVPARVLKQGRWRSTVEVGPRDEPTMLVIGQSHNLGWEATLDGRSLGEPVLVDGYSSGFVLPAGTDPARVEITWAPQRVVLGALAASAAAVIACIALIVVSLRRRRRRGPADGSGATSPEAPAPLDLDQARTSPGSPPSWAATALTAAAFGVVGGLAAGLWVGSGLTVAAFLGLRVRRARPLLALGPAALLAACAVFTIAKQLRYKSPPGFLWVDAVDVIHPVGYAAVLLLALEVVVDRLRTGRFTPTRG